MKIPLEVNPDGLIYTTIIIKAPKYHVKHGLKDFYIDTGSPTTYISERHAQELNVPFKCLTRKEDVMRIGGTNFFAHDMKRVHFGLKNDKEEIVYFVLDTQVVKGSKIKSKEREIALSLPSIIGNDFLINNKLKLYHNPLKKESYLLSVEE